MKACFVDLDGVLNYYPKCWLNYIYLKTGLNIKNLELAKQTLPYKSYIDLKRDYRESDYKLNLEIRDGACTFSHFLKRKEFKIIIKTQRPIKEHPCLFKGTIEWLRRNNILFDEILFNNNNPFMVLSKYPDLSFGVDDDRHYANLLGRWGYRIFLINNHNQGEVGKNVTRVSTFNEIIEALK